MHQAFGTVLWVVCGLGIVAAFIALSQTGKAWADYGKRGLLMERDVARRPTAASNLERDTEIRQFLEARNARRLRRGEAPIDVEQELRRLTATTIDSGLQAEIRELVVARNHRRLKRGQPPLDVEAEVQREIARFSGVDQEPLPRRPL